MEANGIDEALKSSKRKLLKIVNMLNGVNRSICNSFTGPFVWKDPNLVVFLAFHDNEPISCWLDCPMMKVRWMYKCFIKIENVGSEFPEVGIVSSNHQLGLKK